MSDPLEDIIAYDKYMKSTDRSKLTREEIEGAIRVNEKINALDD